MELTGRSFPGNVTVDTFTLPALGERVRQPKVAFPDITKHLTSTSKRTEEQHGTLDH
jgi:hypothetical protein